MIHLRGKHRVSIAWMLFTMCWLLCPPNQVAHRASGQLRGRARSNVDPAPLREIEKRVLPPGFVAGPWSYESLPDYYWAANRQLKSRFDRARKVYEAGIRQRPYQSLTLVAGVAGVGKTFIKGEVFSKDYPKQDTCKFDIRELYSHWLEQGKVQAKPDLSCGKVVINSLLSVRNQREKLLSDHLVKQDSKFYVIDSLDEIHPDDYVGALEQIEDFVFRSGRDFVHVVVFARPLAFCDYWNRYRTGDANRDSSLFLLNAPQLSTTGDLLVSSWNYHCWRHKLGWFPPGEHDSCAMPLHAYAEWTRLGFDQSGVFRTISYEANNSMNRRVDTELTKWAREHSVVAGMLRNLAGNSILREIVSEHVQRGRSYNEREVMEAYLSAWLVRDTKSDDRPSREKPEHLDLYMRLLEAVAVKYLQEQKVDDLGFFTVRPNDEITVRHHDRECTFPVKRILNRSGLIYVDPRPTGGDNYRFEPVWLHRLLVEKHNERQQQAIALQTPTTRNQ